MRSGIVGLILWSGVLLSPGCSKKNDSPDRSTVAERLRGEEKQDEENLDIIVAYPDTETASQDREINGSALVKLEVLDDQGRIVRISGPGDEVNRISLDANARMSRNSGFRIHAPGHSGYPSKSQELSPSELLTVRSVVGVENFLQRFPAADGRGLTVAVFDTGIDFGVRGLSEVVNGKSRLKGFYDFSGFGITEVSDLPGEGGPPLPDFDDSIGQQSLSGFGVLSEQELARNYFAADPVDINGNGRTDDRFTWLIGINKEGKKAVWFDADGNGIIDSRSDEELTDYNSTYRYINLMKRGPLPAVNSLAVTVRQDNKLQFHVVDHGHGTSCALIIGGNGYGDGSLRGLAPGVSFLSYTLDVIGEDVYTMDEFIRMFIHARNQGADAISISWGFSTADLNSARFFADFLDREIASHGVVIAIAAGNNGPGTGSAAGDDYIPHHGFGVGAMVSKEQAVNVYGWTGTDRDAVVDYSSFGPTPGGRLIPDVVSPIITMVRGTRNGDSDPFYGFSGTSSATPALAGALMALVSALPAGEKPDTRLLKLAVQAGARPIPGTLALRQGPGLVRIDQAYDLYQTLSQEMKEAESDQSRQTPFPFELKAKTLLESRSDAGEGIYLHGFVPTSLISVELSEASRSLVDPVTFYAPLSMSHTSDFFEIPAVLNLQASGASFRVLFRADKLQGQAGVFSDVIEVKRPGDQVPLLRIPVVVQLSGHAEGTQLASVSRELQGFDIWRQPVSLSEPSVIRFKGMILASAGYEGARFGFQVRANDGHVAGASRVSLSGAMTSVDFSSQQLPAGNYELVISRNYGRPAVVKPATIHGVWSLPKLKPLAQHLDADSETLSVVLKAREPLSGAYWSLSREGVRGVTRLGIEPDAGRPGFYGNLTLPFPAKQIEVGLRQSATDRYLARYLHMSLTLLDPESGDTRYRGWVDVQDQGSPLEGISLNEEVGSVSVMAYPNIINWGQPGISSVSLAYRVAYPRPLNQQLLPVAPTSLMAGSVVNLRFRGEGLMAGEYGVLTLHGSRGEVIETVPVVY